MLLKQTYQTARGQLLDTIRLDKISKEIRSLDLALMRESGGWNRLSRQSELSESRLLYRH